MNSPPRVALSPRVLKTFRQMTTRFLTSPNHTFFRFLHDLQLSFLFSLFSRLVLAISMVKKPRSSELTSPSAGLQFLVSPSHSSIIRLSSDSFEITPLSLSWPGLLFSYLLGKLMTRPVRHLMIISGGSSHCEKSE